MTAPQIALVAFAALFASTIAGTTGYGIGLTLLPVFSLVLGTRTAVPIVAIVQLASNSSRSAVHRKQLDTKSALWFASGAVPGALVGSWLFAHFPIHGLSIAVGIYLLIIPLLRRKFSHAFKIPPAAFLPVGFLSSVISGLIGIVGPLCAPFFLALGLTKGAFIGTEAFASIFTHISKLIGYGANHVLTSKEVWIGLAIAPITWVGAWIGKHIANRLEHHHFTNLIDLVCLVFGVIMIWRGP